MSKKKHPMQQVYIDKHGTYRFRENEIVRRLLDEGDIDLNQIATWDVSRKDREQFIQLIGYSVSGFGELGYVSTDAYETAMRVSLTEDDPLTAENTLLNRKLRRVRCLVKRLTVELFHIHSDDLKL